MNASRQPGLLPPQFRLRTMMLLVGILCVVLAVSKVLGPYGSFAFILFVLSVIAHVAGNAIGTRLRARGGRESSPDDTSTRPHSVDRTLTHADFAPASRLSQKQSPGVLIFAAGAVGGLIGTLLGGTFLFYELGNKATIANMTLGITASGVIGGIGGFLISIFVKNLVAANVDAWQSGNSGGRTERPPDKVTDPTEENVQA